jgi:hypothetical protein
MGDELMGQATERLMKYVSAPDRYDIPFEDLRAPQIEAVNERFQEQKAAIKLLRYRAQESAISEIRRHEDVVPVLFPHTAYKSYPEAYLSNGRWDRLANWLGTVSSQQTPSVEPSVIADIDDFVDTLKSSGIYVSCSSGTTGKCAMLAASSRDLEWCGRESVAAFAWGSGVAPVRDRQVIGTGIYTRVPRNEKNVEAFSEAIQDSSAEPFAFPVQPVPVNSVIEMTRLRRSIAEGSASPGEIERMERLSAERQKALDDAVAVTAEAVVRGRAGKLHFRGLWAAQYAVAKAVRDLGYKGSDFGSDNSISVAGGLKRALLPDDYREYVYETFNIRPERIYLNYSMQELHSSMPRCQAGGRYHLPPWLVPLILTQDGNELLPIEHGEYEGRAAFFDLSLDGRWGGIVSGDKVNIDFSGCACGHRGPTIRDNVVRYVDMAGDDKITCAGTVDAYIRGVT